MSDVELIGPMLGTERTFKVAIDGYFVPWVKVICTSPVSYSIRLTGRMEWEFDGDRQQLDQVLRLTANALSIGAGLTCFGTNKRVHQPFDVKIGRIDAVRLDSPGEDEP